MKTKYEVIWIDDEWEKMDAFKEECEVIHQIYLHPFKTREAGMDEFDKNPKKWDAIILDAKMKDKSENEVPRLDGLRKAVAHINEKALLRKVPYFISTGQPDLMDNETFEQSFGTYYIKERDDQKLINDIKNIASQSTRLQVKMFYPETMEQLNLLSGDVLENVIDVLEIMHFPDSHPDFVPHLYYNPMRKGLECIFRAANKAGIIPDVLISGGVVNLNQCFMFMIGRDADKVGYRYGNPGEKIVPRHIQDMMSMILNLGNSNSHSTELSQNEITQFERNIDLSGIKSKYLVFSLALQLCELALWMHQYIASHPNYQENQGKWIKLESPSNEKKLESKEIIGLIEKDDNGLFHIGPKHLVFLKLRKEELKGKKVKAVKYSLNKNSNTNNTYPFFVNEFDILLIESPENGSM